MANDDPHTERQRLVARLVALQQEMQSDPHPETRAQLLQAREALVQLDEMRHARRSRSGGIDQGKLWFRPSRRIGK
jgi:antitoxin (DNA-binding transcriptional repressor) of toxin-antitoxin stability system